MSRTLTDETKQKISDTLKKLWENDEYREKMKKSLSGRIRTPMSDETKQKISLAKMGSNKGENHYNFGKKQSDETKKKMSDAHKKLWENDEYRERMKKSLSGRICGPPSDEKRKKVSEKLKEKFKYEKHSSFGKKHSEETKQKIIMAKTGMKYNKNKK